MGIGQTDKGENNMDIKEQYINVNVPTTIYNQIHKAYYGEGNFDNLIYKRCYEDDNCGICSMEEYYNACIDYINNLKCSDDAYEKWVKELSDTYVKPTWRQNIKEEFNCKSNKEFIALAKRIIEG